MRRFITFAGGIVLGSVLTASIATVYAASQSSKAYLVVAGELIDATGLEAYGAKAGPAAAKAGIKILGRNSDITADHVLEGEWPYPGSLTVEEFSSMDALLGFWHSEDYQAAIKLREGKVKLHFVVAVPGMAQ